jgi:uncharacterized membrane protein
LWVEVTTNLERPSCCGRTAWHHGTGEVVLVDLPVFGRLDRLAWRKHRWRCPTCGRTWTEQHPEIASARCALTTRAARWATLQVGRHGRCVAEVADDLGCDGHTVMDAVELYGTPLIDDPDRFDTVTALGLDETLFCHEGRFRIQCWSTQIVDVRCGQLLDVVPGRDSSEPCRWLAGRSDDWCAGVEWATLDLSSAYRTVFQTMLPDAVQVADPFHVARLATTSPDECRRRVHKRHPRPSGPPARSALPSPPARPDHHLAPIPRLEWTDRSRQQPGQARQASRVQDAEPQPPPHPLTALRRQAQLGPTRNHHPIMKSEVPLDPLPLEEDGGPGRHHRGGDAMLMIGPVLLVVVVVLLVALGRRRPGGETEQPRAHTVTVSAEVAEVLDRAVARGTLSREAADAILADERERRLAPPSERRPVVSPLVEAIGYVGASLVMIGMAVLVGSSWEDLVTWSRLAILGGVAVALFVVGALLRDESEPVIWRLRNFVRLLSTGALAGFVGVLTVDALEWPGAPVAIAIGATVAAYSLALWQLQDRPAQHLSTLLGLLIGAGGLMAAWDGPGAVGLAVLAIGAGWLALGSRGVLPPPLVAGVLGLAACLIGPAITAGSWEHASPVIGLAVSVTLIVVGTMIHQFLVTGAGVLGLFAYVPYTLGVFFGESVGAPVILLVSGAMLLVVMFVLLRSRHGTGRPTGSGPPVRPALH